MVLSAAGIFILRRRARGTDDLNFQSKWYPVLPLIFITAYSFVGISIFITETKISLIAIAVLSVFLAIYFVFIGKRRLRTQ